MRRRKDQAGLCRAMGLAAALALAPPPSSAEIPSPFAITDISEALTRAYNGEDAPALQGSSRRPCRPATRRRPSGGR